MDRLEFVVHLPVHGRWMASNPGLLQIKLFLVTVYKSFHEHMLPFVLGKGLGVGRHSYIVYMFNF